MNSNSYKFLYCSAINFYLIDKYKTIIIQIFKIWNQIIQICKNKNTFIIDFLLNKDIILI